ncbi:L-lactate dehydrogenase (cytochrome) [Povalibacter uvarum]|uniref:L-lactate dehydrogenase (Cytochrome) n=1 Tax=Povalibacter uvarum TaxID=732238 RepID=A0A841HRT1_9GAMM|nr:alpha-hydroxy acid oxidase [Povalibacter uvarum]MBB6095473.1 L-lactate dehydrogenase (cytochrome) [Povalibacter uvarum]
MTVINSIADLRERARRRIPRAIFEYADRGSYDEVTFRRNRHDLEALAFRQRVMVDVSKQALATTLLGEPAAIPLAIAPTGLTGLFHADGEMLGARAAEAFGIPFCLSTMSICSIEDVRSVTKKPFWFQIYLMRERSFNMELIERAKAAQCSTLVLTVDLPIMGLRRRDAKNGLSIPPKLTFGNLFDVATKPAWGLKVLFGRRRTFGNLEDLMKRSGGSLTTLSAWIASQFDPTVTWADIEWVRKAWPGKLIIKGVLDAEDARHACAAGVDGIVVSNHGGRQLDGAPSTISVLPEIVDAVQGRCEVLFDGGVQSGQDILKALALGARGCLIGKTFLYALAAGGEAGVTQALGILRDELRVSLALTGGADVRSVDSSILRTART